jgi:hypothetical protein
MSSVTRSTTTESCMPSARVITFFGRMSIASLGMSGIIIR